MFKILNWKHKNSDNVLANRSDSAELGQQQTNSKHRCTRNILHGMKTVLYFFSIIVVVPLAIYCILKLYLFHKYLDVRNPNADIGSAVGTLIALHVLLAVYLLRLIILQDASDPTNPLQVHLREWKPLETQRRGTAITIILLIFYGSLMFLVPLLAFFLLKFVVFENIFLITNVTVDVLAAIVLVVAAHCVLALFIYHAYYGGGVARRLMSTSRKMI